MNYVQTGKNAILGAAAAVMIAGGLSLAMAQEIPIPAAAAPFVPFGDRGQAADQHGDGGSEDAHAGGTFVVLLREAAEQDRASQPAPAVRVSSDGRATTARQSAFESPHQGGPGAPDSTDEPTEEAVDEPVEDTPDDTPTPQVNPAIGSGPTDMAVAQPPVTKTPVPSFSASDVLSTGDAEPVTPGEGQGDDDDGGGVQPLVPAGIGLAAQTAEPAEPAEIAGFAPLAIVTPSPEPSPVIIGGFQKLTALEESTTREAIASR